MLELGDANRVKRWKITPPNGYGFISIELINNAKLLKVYKPWRFN